MTGSGMGGDIDDGSIENEIGVALLPKLRRKDENADTTPYGAGGLSAVLPKVQIYLRDSFQERKNRRNQNARRLDAVQSEKIGLYCVYCFMPEVKEKECAYLEYLVSALDRMVYRSCRSISCL